MSKKTRLFGAVLSTVLMGSPAAWAQMPGFCQQAGPGFCQQAGPGCKDIPYCSQNHLCYSVSAQSAQQSNPFEGTWTANSFCNTYGNPYTITIDKNSLTLTRQLEHGRDNITSTSCNYDQYQKTFNCSYHDFNIKKTSAKLTESGAMSITGICSSPQEMTYTKN